jgi:hypothetical protein
MSAFGPDSSANRAWRHYEHEKSRHAETRAEVARLRAALGRIAAGDVDPVRDFARAVLARGNATGAAEVDPP